MSCVTPMGEDSCKCVPGFLLSLSHVLFPFADVDLYLFTEINHTCKDDSLVDPPCESLNVGVVLGHPPPI